MEATGQLISQYRLLGKLGAGGMGAVYRAEDTRLGRHVALKLLPPLRADDPEARVRFQTEARAVAALEHPNVCQVYEFDEQGGQPFLVMQLVEGETLSARITRGALPEPAVREIVRAVGGALSEAHAHGILHRDVKGANILIGADGRIKLADFGVARLLEDASVTKTSEFLGTPAYMAPERVEGHPASEASDQFSLGVVTYECLTGRRPFAGDSSTAVIYSLLHTEPEPPSVVREGLAPGWDGAVLRALHKDPSRRHASIEDFVRAVFALAPSSAAPRAHVTENSLAVLYFENLSSDPDSEYFCAGITEDILTDLSKLPGLKVASRNAVARYRGQSVDIRRAGIDLGVRAVMEGSVRRQGNRVRITAQLIQASDGFHLWADRYDRTLEDVFAVQEDIARSIALALRGALTPQEERSLQVDRPNTARAYDLYLKGRGLYQKYTSDGMQAALACFEEALALEPDYALAWAGIADACAQMYQDLWDRTPLRLERASAAAGRAVAANPLLPEVHKSRSLILDLQGDERASIAALERALELDPQFAPALGDLAVLCFGSGDLAGCERHVRRKIAIEGDSAWSSFMLTVVLASTRRHAEAAEIHLVADPAHLFGKRWLMMRIYSLASLGRHAEAAVEVKGAREAGVAGCFVAAAEAAARMLAGDHAGAAAILEQNRHLPGDPASDFFFAEVAAWVGSTADLFHYLRQWESHTSNRPYFMLRILPGLESVQELPEFRSWIADRGRRLVWPLEAPPLTRTQRARFADYSEASGLPEAAP
ncbi:MAG: protein kinase [Candidatus Eisenbacteria bacterium]|nr:protein kinase [Candidatus Eisenbacteria bacterium]